MISGPGRSRSITLFSIAIALYWSSMYVYVPTLSVHAENLGASVSLVGMIVAAYGLPQLLLRIPLGVWSDRIGLRKPFIVAGMVASALAGLGLALSTNPEWLIVWRGLSGVAASAFVVFTVLFSGYFAHQEIHKAMARINFISGAAQVIATYAGGLIAQTWGWFAPFWTAVGLAAIGMVAASQLEEKAEPVRRSVSAGELLRIGTVPLLLVVSVVAMLTSWSQWATVNGFSLVYAGRLGASRADLGLLTTLMQIGFTLGSLGSAFLADRIGLRTTVIAGLIVQSVGALMVPLTTSVAVVGLTQVLGGSGRALSYVVLMGLSIRAVPSAEPATAMGAFQAIYAIGMFGGPATAGLLGDVFGFSSIFVVAGAATLVGIPLVLSLVPKE